MLMILMINMPEVPPQADAMITRKIPDNLLWFV
jgi:hypothetical protein